MRKKAIFVHGCSWHRHADPDCNKASLPKTNRDYWLPKLERNKERDAEQQARFAALGWEIMVLWECEAMEGQGLAERIREFLDGADLLHSRRLNR